MNALDTIDPTKPVTLLDVDDVLNVYNPRGKTPKRSWTDWEQTTAMGYKIVYSPSMIDYVNNVLAKRTNIFWLSTWRDAANYSLAPAVGIRHAFPVADHVVDASLGNLDLLPGSNSHPFAKDDWHKWRVFKVFMHRLGPEGRVLWIDNDILKWHRQTILSAYGDRVLPIVPFVNVGFTPDHVSRIDQWLDVGTKEFTG